MSYLLKKLKPIAREHITSDSYLIGVPVDENLLEEFHRTVDIEPLIAVVQEARNSEKSDGWLAPRVHASLRLHRWEAAEHGIWDYLSVVIPELRAYVIGRYGKDGKIGLKPVIGATSDHAFARLWWTAELSRNGPDYSLVKDSFTVQDIADILTGYDAGHNRAAALAFVRFVKKANNGQPATVRQVQTLGRIFNHVLTTVMLDAVAPDDGPDAEAIEDWIQIPPDETLMFNALPDGPNDVQVPEDRIAEVEKILEQLWQENSISTVTR